MAKKTPATKAKTIKKKATTAKKAQTSKTDSADLQKVLKNARKYHGTKQKRVGMLFSGGPAPGGNAVISAAALAFLNDGWEVIGFYKGYEYLQQFDREKPRQFREGFHFKRLGYEDVTKIRQLGGIVIKTARANPSSVGGREIQSVQDLIDPTMSKKIYNVLDALEFMGIQALISIGGDDTLKTAFYLNLLGLPVVHVPKTIDNDYFGIPWTFGYFTAIEHARQAIKVFNVEAQTTDAWWVLELMGRKAGWYTLGAGISGEAVRMIGPEEMGDSVDLNRLATEILNLVIEREKYGKRYGVVLISEGLVDHLPKDQIPQEVDEHGNIRFADALLGYRIAKMVSEMYFETTGRKLRVKSETIGYTTRCAEPSAFDILLGSQLGAGAFRFISQRRGGNMVSVGDNLEIKAVPFSDLIDAKTFRTKVRYVPIDGDFFKLAKSLEFRRQHED
ncbi:MAG: 6-phosphofructokinase [Candidatus Lernaella stagnicola]|nr:6-phosphofructokinase [Candidatus Lernaella stagnicola]